MSDLMTYLKGNNPTSLALSSNQIFTLFDEILFRAADSLVENTEFFETSFGSVIAWYNSNKRRKLSRIPRDKAISLMVAFILTKDINVKKEILRTLMLERGLILDVLKRFLDLTEGYHKLLHRQVNMHHKFAASVSYRIHVIERSVLARENGDVYSCINIVRLWYTTALEMRDLVMQKYTRFIFSKVRQEVDRSTVMVDVNDLAQNYVIALIKAIHKYLPERGTFQSYLEYWILDAKTNVDSKHYYGVAFDIPNMNCLTEGTLSNLYQSMDSAEVESVSTSCIEDEIVENAHILRVRELAEYADPIGYARASLNIDA